jgi:hypothetical protein
VQTPALGGDTFKAFHLSPHLFLADDGPLADRLPLAQINRRIYAVRYMIGLYIPNADGTAPNIAWPLHEDEWNALLARSTPLAARE